MSYFQTDCRDISASALASPDGFTRVATFVLLTIQQQLVMVPKAMADVDAKGRSSAFLFGSKRAGYVYVQTHKIALHSAALQYKRGEISFNELLLQFIAIPGLGLVKASFLAQCSVTHGACIDTHNLTRLGLPVSAFKLPKGLKIDNVLARITAYQAICDASGDSAYWWDSWCDHLAQRKQYVTRGMTGANVSALHRVAILPSAATQRIAA
jgi:hypothetical protein